MKTKSILTRLAAMVLFPAIALAASLAFADPYDWAEKSVFEFPTTTTAPASGDKKCLFVAADNKVECYSATSEKIGGAFNGTVGATTPSTGAFTSLTTTLGVVHTRTPGADSGLTNNGSKVTLTTPIDTTGTNTHNAYDVAITEGNASGGTNTVNGLAIENVTGDAQNNTNGISIGTGTTLGTSYAIKIGSGWDLDLSGASGITESGAITASGGIDGILGGVTPAAATVTNFTSNSGTFTIDSVAVNRKALSLPGRAVISICGDGTTINNNTVFYGPSMVPVANALRTCDTTQVGNVTEATADAPALDNTAFQVLSMDCLTADPGASGVSFTLRNNAAATVPSVTCSVANTKLGCTADIQTTTAIAAGNPISIAAASAGNQGTTPFACQIQIAY